MTLTVVIDGAIEHQVAWPDGAEKLRQQIKKWVTKSEVGAVRTPRGSVLVNWRAVRTVEVRET